MDLGNANANVDTGVAGSEKDYARQMPALTREQIRAYQDAQMVEVSPLSKNASGDTMKMDQPRAQAPQPRKKILGLF